MKTKIIPQRVNITLKDNTILKDTVIFPTGTDINSKGVYSLESKELINEIFTSDKNRNSLIHFQTIYINGRFHPCNVLSYQFVENIDTLKCNHRDKNSELTIKYDSNYEMRSSDMHCTQCKKQGARYEFEEGTI